MKTIRVQFEDSEGPFEIEVLLPLVSPLLDSFNELTVEAARMSHVYTAYENGTITRETLKREDQKIMDRLHRFLGDICIDPPLDYEFWAKGEGYSVDVPLKIFNAISREILKARLENLEGVH